MKTLSRGLYFSIVLLTFISSTSAMEGVQLPAFNASDCVNFRGRLLNHTLLSFYDRKHATNLGIAAVSLFWTGLPAIPLGMAAIWTGRRQATAAVEELLLSGVTDENFREINLLCAILLRTSPVQNATVDGRNTTAVALGAVSMALALCVFVIQCCYGIFTLWNSKSGDDEGEELLHNIENIAVESVNTVGD